MKIRCWLIFVFSLFSLKNVFVLWQGGSNIKCDIPRPYKRGGPEKVPKMQVPKVRDVIYGWSLSPSILGLLCFALITLATSQSLINHRPDSCTLYFIYIHIHTSTSHSLLRSEAASPSFDEKPLRVNYNNSIVLFLCSIDRDRDILKTRLYTTRFSRPWTLVVNKPAERGLKFKISMRLQGKMEAKS